MEHESSEPIEMIDDCSTSDSSSVHSRFEGSQVLEILLQKRQSLEDEAKRQALLERLQMNEYMAETRRKLRSIAKEGWQQEQAERSHRIESREAKISAFTTQQIERAEDQYRIDLENAKKYPAGHHTRSQQVGALAQRKLANPPIRHREARSSERHALWDSVKAMGIQRKQVVARAFPKKPIEAAIETFKKWLSGASFADNSAADGAIRTALDVVKNELRSSHVVLRPRTPTSG
jgi:hypothetical protein